MNLNDKTTFCVCILAHNEEKNIGRTIATICSTNNSCTFPVYVYANGCTDRTIEVVTRFVQTHQNVHLIELPVASKPGAWNAAFAERKDDFIIFSDGDVVIDAGAAIQLVNELKATPHAVIASCRQVAINEGLTFQQKFVGFMQIPLDQNFLAGGFYAVRRQVLADLLVQKGFTGLPPGVAGEDAFLDYLVGPECLIVSEACSAYVPPSLGDYSRYLARIRWQNEQIRHYYQNIVADSSSLKRAVDKVTRISSFRRLFVAFLAVSTRYIYKMLFSSQIAKHYRDIGPQRINGAEVLRDATRSLSTK